MTRNGSTCTQPTRRDTQERQMENGEFLVPARYDQRGWHHLGPEPLSPYVAIWAVTLDDADRAQVDRVFNAGRARNEESEWLQFLDGKNSRISGTGVPARSRPGERPGRSHIE